MKSIRRFAQIQVLLLSLLSSTVVPMAAHADEVQGRFTLTSETHWGSAVLPPGEYVYSFATRSALPVLLLRSVNGNSAAFIAATGETDTKDRMPGLIKIESRGGVQFITELHVNDSGLVFHYKIPATVELAAKSPEPSLTASVGKK
jgi:hypothetical protein